MQNTILGEIRDWILRNGRALEVSLFSYHFEGGARENVLNALKAYQNEDGGFGHALEPDNWNPNSSPYTTAFALNILRDLGVTDKAHPLIAGALGYLSSGADMQPYGWRFSIPTNDDHPHAPWWNYDARANEVQSVGLTGELCAFAFEYADKSSPLYATCERLAGELITKLFTQHEFGDMGVGGYIALLEALKAHNRTDFPLDDLQAKLRALVNGAIERDPSKWAYYCKHPTDLINSPDSPYYPDNAQIVNAELEYLLSARAPKGVWNITWTWFDNNAKYAPQFAISENWWKAYTAIEKARVLSAFNAI